MKERLSGAERRQQIVEAATDLFSRKGFSGTTTREIAEAVGLTEAMIFRHFETKRQLYAAIIEAKAKTEELLASVAAASVAKDAAAVFRTVGLRLLEENEHDPTLMRLLLFSALEGHELSDLFFESRVRQLHELLSNYIRQQIEEGHFRPLDPLVAARAFIGMVIHYLLVHGIFGVKRPPWISPEEVVETFVSIFLEGIER